MRHFPTRDRRSLVGLASTICIVLLFSLGCESSHPGNWDETKTEAKLRESLKLDSLDLSPTPDGFSGSGTDAEGQTYQITVTQSLASKKLEYVANGDRGVIEEGAFVFE